MGDDVEVQAVGLERAGIIPSMAKLHIAIAGLRILPGDQRNELKLVVTLVELPGERPAEIAFENIQNAAQRAIDMHCYEFAAIDRIMVEMSVGPWLDRWITLPPIGRQVGVFVGDRLLDGVDDIHPIIGWTRLYSAGGRGQPDHLRIAKARQEWGLRVQPHPRAEVTYPDIMIQRQWRLHPPDTMIVDGAGDEKCNSADLTALRAIP